MQNIQNFKHTGLCSRAFKIMVLSATLMACSACAMLDQPSGSQPMSDYELQMRMNGLAQSLRGFDTTGTSNALPMRQPAAQPVQAQPCTNLYSCPAQYYQGW